jgi:DNA-binding response OmpR family regulator
MDPSICAPPLALNVNDDEASRYLISRLLKSAGFAVIEASTGAEALRLAAKNPALVLLDIRLPDGSGVDVCRRLKASSGVGRVILVSAAFERGATPPEVEDGGADGYMPRDLDVREAVERLRELRG